MLIPHRKQRLNGAQAGLLGAAVLLLSACVSQPRFGNYGGPYQPAAEAKEVPSRTGILWYPIQARFAPDGSRLVVNLCRSSRARMDDCRLAEYRPEGNRWRLLPTEPGHSHMWPSFSPDGRRLAFVDLPCDAQGRCNVLQGQLATMPAEGGAPTHHGIYGVRRPVFHPEGGKIAYWRYYGVNRLASGRTAAAEAVYELDLATGAEKNWLANTRLPLGGNFHAFDLSIAGPFYFPDGEHLQFCGYQTSGGWPIQTAIKCARAARDQAQLSQIHAKSLAKASGRDDSSFPVTRIVFGRGTANTLLGQSSDNSDGLALAIIDSTSLRPIRRLLDYGGYTVGDADYSASTRKVVALTGFLTGTGAHSPHDRHWIAYSTDKIAYPAMAIIDLDTLQYQAVEWPNVEAIPVDSAPKEGSHP